MTFPAPTPSLEPFAIPSAVPPMTQVPLQPTPTQLANSNTSERSSSPINFVTLALGIAVGVLVVTQASCLIATVVAKKRRKESRYYEGITLFSGSIS